MKKELLLTAFLISNLLAFSQKENLAKTSAGFPVNYEEDSVGSYTLPDLFTLSNGKKITDAETWTEKRRPELLKLIETIQYGKMSSSTYFSSNLFDKGNLALNGTAIRKQVTIYFTKDTSDHKVDLLIYLPVNATKPVPVLLNISFVANCQAVDDPGNMVNVLRSWLE